MSLLSRAAEWLVPAAQAHEKWFIPVSNPHGEPPAMFSAYSTTSTLVLSLLAIVFAFAWFADRAYERSPMYAKVEGRIRPYRDLASLVLGVTTGFALLWFAAHGQLLAPNFVLPETFGGSLLMWAEAVIGGLLMVGLFAPAAAVGLIALYAATFGLYGWLEPIDYINMLGIGLLLLFFARGRYSMDWFLGKPILTTPAQRKWAYLALRVLTGVALAWLGLWKFLRPDLHFALMDKFADFNPFVILHSVGIGISREAYVFCLAVVETSIGVAVALGLFSRVFAVMLTPIMLVSVIFLGFSEIVGHLPIVGTLMVFFVYGDTYHKHRDERRKPALARG